MSIQWFPGHMAKALRELKEKESIVDLFIVVLDSRAPLSTYNEEFDKIAPSKPRLIVLTKKDLGDISKVDKVKSHFNHDNDKVIIVNLKQKNASRKKILSAAKNLLISKRERDEKKGLLKPRLRCFVVGVPNSGKSTLINVLASKNKTKTGNMPGITRGQQWVKADDIQLLDSPGILWPKFEDELTGIKLAIIGSIKTSIIEPMELFYNSYKLLSTFYPKHITYLGLKPSLNEKEMYSQLIYLCKIKNFLKPPNDYHFEKAIIWFSIYLRDLKGVTYD